MSEAYKNRKDPDGFLYITYTDETTLGGEQDQWTYVKININQSCTHSFFYLTIEIS